MKLVKARAGSDASRWEEETLWSEWSCERASDHLSRESLNRKRLVRKKYEMEEEPRCDITLAMYTSMEVTKCGNEMEDAFVHRKIKCCDHKTSHPQRSPYGSDASEVPQERRSNVGRHAREHAGQEDTRKSSRKGARLYKFELEILRLVLKTVKRWRRAGVKTTIEREEPVFGSW